MRKILVGIVSLLLAASPLLYSVGTITTADREVSSHTYTPTKYVSCGYRNRACVVIRAGSRERDYFTMSRTGCMFS